MQKSYKLHTKTLQKLGTKKITEIDGFYGTPLGTLLLYLLKTRLTCFMS